MLSIMNIDHNLIIESKQDNFFPSLKCTFENFPIQNAEGLSSYFNQILTQDKYKSVNLALFTQGRFFKYNALWGRNVLI